MKRSLAFFSALALLLTVAGVATARERERTGLHDERYCEILELRGQVPDARVLVWNTVGLNTCPAAKWDAIDAATLAQERGDALVIKNGPRHWVIDSASGQAGSVESFGGIRMRRVATIPIRSSADLARAPYTERTINRTNTWHWNKGRTVFELLAPDGSNYIMQSYSQILDPKLSLGQLPKLGRRLSLPAGWAYRTRRLKRPLDLRAKGSATILQDDLSNTYQLLPPNPNAPKPKAHAVHLAGQTKTTGSPAPGTLRDQGTFTGAPIGTGEADIVVTLADGKATGTFTLDTAKGDIFGTVDMTYAISGSQITFDGTAAFTGGTGTYRGITAKNLAVHDENTLDGQNGAVTMDGTAKY